MPFATWSASAVDGLTPDNVVLVDASGHLPLGPKTAEAMQLTAEQALEDKLISTLEPVTGAGNVRASVTLDYDHAASDITQETYDPDKTVTLSMQRTEQTTGPQPVAAGVPGTASNAPNTQALPVYPQQTTPPQSAKTESGTYGASKTDRHVVEGPGRVRRLTAAIVVNDRLVQAAGSRKTRSLAAAFAGGDPQPDGTGPGSRRLRCLARGHAHRRRSAPSIKTAPQPPTPIMEKLGEHGGELSGAGQIRRSSGGSAGGAGLRSPSRPSPCWIDLHWARASVKELGSRGGVQFSGQY